MKQLQELDHLADPLVAQLRRLSATDASGSEVGAPRTDRGGAIRPPARQAVVFGLPWRRARRRLGKFELLERLGAGSFGYVFRARDTELGRMVAIKIPRAGHLASQEDAARFLREAQSAAQLKHPGIVALHETGQADDGTFYLVEEFVQGTTLADRLGNGPLHVRRGGRPHRRGGRRPRLRPPPRRDPPRHQALQHPARRGWPAAPDGLRAGQAGGRGDLDDPGRPGAGHAGLHVARAGAGRVAPGRCPQRHLQPRGRPLRAADRRTPVPGQPANADPPGPGGRAAAAAQLNDKIPRDLETICLKAMAKSPARRYASARELADDLRRYRSGEPIRARPVGRVERLWHWCRRNPVAASLLLAVSLGSAVGLGHLSLLSEQLVRSTALEGAAQQSEMLDVVNALYSSQVVDRVQSHGVVVTHDYATKSGAIPLPATFTIESGQRIGERSKTGMLFRLYSDYPFRSRKDGGPRDDFERIALADLRRNPDAPVYRFEVFQNRPSLRYATARRMEANCIGCHNNDPNSTKRDWKEGEVGGVLEIIRPLDRDIARTHEGLRGTFVLMAVVSGTLLAALRAWSSSSGRGGSSDRHAGDSAERKRVTPRVKSMGEDREVVIMLCVRARSSFNRHIASRRQTMSRYRRREFLADVGRGMLVASVGSALAQDLGLAPAALADGGDRAPDVRADGAAGGPDAGDARRPALAGRRGTDEERDGPSPARGGRRPGQRPHVRRPGLRRLPRAHGARARLPDVVRAARGAAGAARLESALPQHQPHPADGRASRTRPCTRSSRRPCPRASPAAEALREATRRQDIEGAERALRRAGAPVARRGVQRPPVPRAGQCQRPPGRPGLALLGPPRPDGQGARPHPAPPVGAVLRATKKRDLKKRRIGEPLRSLLPQPARAERACRAVRSGSAGRTTPGSNG